jgi:hypothetical protein
VTAETPAPRDAGSPVPPEPAAPARFPWRALALAASVVVLGLPVALLAFAFPFSAFVATLDRRPRRYAAAALAAALPLAMTLAAPAAGFFVAVATLAVAAAIVFLRRLPRTGYPEISLGVFGGMLVGAALWLRLDPGLFGHVRAAVEGETQAILRDASARLAASTGLDAESRAAIDQVFASSARWYARLWPVGVFVVLWLGVGVALELAARWSRGAPELASRVTAGEPFSTFRLADVWIWILLAGMAGFLAFPLDTAAGETALNVALVATGLFACQGTAVALYYVQRRGISRMGKAALVVAFFFLPIPLLVTALCLGLADAWLGLRHRPGPDASAGGPTS